jgi:hypothetical protein
MPTERTLTFPYPIRSLAWDRGRLYDAFGETWVALDGSVEERSAHWGGLLDRAVVSPSGTFSVRYAVNGTKAVVGALGRVVRELDRSYYYAERYAYPIALGTLPTGEEVVVHCPDGYNRLAVDTLADGRRLAGASDGAEDVFHSRLAVSPDGRHLLSAGWVWHPWGVVLVYDLEQALADPATLDGYGVLPTAAVSEEVEGACWLDADWLAVATAPDEEHPYASDGESLGSGALGVWSLSERRWVSQVPCRQATGSLHACGPYVLAEQGHPRLLDLDSGEVVAEWPHLPTRARAYGSIGRQQADNVPLAVDAAAGRFALGYGYSAVVVDVG